MRTRSATLFVVALLGLLFAGMSAPKDSVAYIYWSNEVYDLSSQETTRGLGRANLDGSGAIYREEDWNQTPSPLVARGSHLYWISGNGNLMRSDLDGSNVDPNFIEGIIQEPGECCSEIPTGLAVTGEYAYWAFFNGSKIGRVKLDGTGLNRNFITGLGSVKGLTTYGEYLYWTDQNNPEHKLFSEPQSGAVIGRSTLAGGELDRDWVTGFNFYCSACAIKGYVPLRIGSIAANASNLYVALNRFLEPPVSISTSIRRVPRAGGTPGEEMIKGFGSNQFAPDLAANETHVYWLVAGQYGFTIGRANADGTNVHHAFICNIQDESGIFPQAISGIAVDSGYSESAKEVSPRCLLRERVPDVRLDSQESYRPDSVETITANWGDEEHGLWWEYPSEKAVEEGDPYGNTLHYWGGFSRSSNPFENDPTPFEEGGWIGLWPGFLGATYPDEIPIEASEEDWIDERNDHYAEDAQTLENLYSTPPWDLSDHVYARIVADENGKNWLQYWFWYYYNNYEFSVLEPGAHEGDWEMVQVGLNENNNPDEVVFAQHDSQSVCAWNSEVTTSEMTYGPVVYTAVGSHASYPDPGQWDLPSSSPASDHADGEGAQIYPTFTEVTETTPSWIDWPGRWGGTTAGELEWEANSPRGPKFDHGQWGDPLGFAEEAVECKDRFEHSRAALRSPEGGGAAGVTPPVLVKARKRGDHVTVTYRSPEAAKPGAERMLLSVVLEGDATPLSETIKQPKRRGKVRLPFELEGRPMRVLASVFDAEGRRSEVVSVPVSAP